MKKNHTILLSIIIVNYNAPELIKKCLMTIKKYITLSKEIIIVDNDSQEECLDYLKKKYGFVKVIQLSKNMGFGYANNVGVKEAQGEIVLLLNTDTEIIDYSINKGILDFKKKYKNCMWGFKLIWPNRSFQNSFSKEITFFDFIFSYTTLSFLKRYIKKINKHKYDFRSVENITKVDIIYGACILLWRKDYLKLNGFNDHYFMYFEDVDFCDRFRKEFNGKIYLYPFVSLIHNVQGGQKKIININYFQSKYRYGWIKFKILKMIIFTIIDILTLFIYLPYKKINLLFNSK